MSCLISAVMTPEKCAALRQHTALCRECGGKYTRVIRLELDGADYEVLRQAAKRDGKVLEDELALLVREMAENAREKRVFLA